MNNGGCAIGGCTLMTTVASHHSNYSMNIVLLSTNNGIQLCLEGGTQTRRINGNAIVFNSDPQLEHKDRSISILRYAPLISALPEVDRSLRSSTRAVESV